MPSRRGSTEQLLSPFASHTDTLVAEICAASDLLCNSQLTQCDQLGTLVPLTAFTWTSANAGEYIAVEKVEAMYKKSSLVEQIWVYGNSFESTLVAVVVPTEEGLKAWASQNGMDADFAAICRDKRTNDYLSAELTQTAKAGKLKVILAAASQNSRQPCKA